MITDNWTDIEHFAQFITLELNEYIRACLLDTTYNAQLRAGWNLRERL